MDVKHGLWQPLWDRGRPVLCVCFPSGSLKNDGRYFIGDWRLDAREKKGCCQRPDCHLTVMEVEWSSFKLCPGLPCQVVRGVMMKGACVCSSRSWPSSGDRQTYKQMIAIAYSDVEQAEIGQRKEWHFPPNLKQSCCLYNKPKPN